MVRPKCPVELGASSGPRQNAAGATAALDGWTLNMNSSLRATKNKVWAGAETNLTATDPAILDAFEERQHFPLLQQLPKLIP